MVEQEEPGRDLAGWWCRWRAGGRYRGPVGALPAGRRGREGGRCRRGVFRSSSGRGAGGADRPLVWHGPAALVPVLVGVGGGLGPGEPGRGPGFLPVAAAGREAGAAALARAGPGIGAAVPVAGEVYAPSVRAHNRCNERSRRQLHRARTDGAYTSPATGDRRTGSRPASLAPVRPHRLPGQLQPPAANSGPRPGSPIQATPDAHKNRNQRSRSIPYERTVGSARPAA